MRYSLRERYIRFADVIFLPLAEAICFTRQRKSAPSGSEDAVYYYFMRFWMQTLEKLAQKQTAPSCDKDAVCNYFMRFWMQTLENLAQKQTAPSCDKDAVCNYFMRFWMQTLVCLFVFIVRCNGKCGYNNRCRGVSGYNGIALCPCGEDHS